jgi:8-oxo-dGTP pyrophosphatase MutT (NUDIX family)
MVSELADGAGRIDDEEPITPTPPYGATVVVYRPAGAQREYLVLHRAYFSPDFAGEWAWGPPSGSRRLDEDVERCAVRELFEETGLQLAVHQAEGVAGEWLVYWAEATGNTEVRLSPEHDRFAWVPLNRATALVAPAVVRAQLERVAALLDTS